MHPDSKPNIMKAQNQYTTIHPGEILRDELDAREIKQKDFATTLGMPASVLNQLIQGKRSITPDIAVLLESTLGIEASHWLRLQAERDIEVAKNKAEYIQKQRDIESWKSIQDCCNVNFLEKYISNGLGKSIPEKIQSVFSFFDVSSIQELKIKFVSDVNPAFFRKSEKLTNNPVNLFTWKYIAFAESDTIVIPKKFDRNGLYDICKQLETIFLENSDTVAKITNLLNSYGIKFFLFDNEKGTHIDGFSFMRNGTPNIVLTLRHKKIDILAFTLLHELYHTFVHLTGNEDNNMISLADYKESSEEQEADSFATNSLIPLRQWQIFKARNKGVSPYAISKKIREFANEYGIHPAIVLGRYQHEFNIFDNGRGFDRNIG